MTIIITPQHPPKKTDQRMLQRHLSLWKVKKGFNEHVNDFSCACGGKDESNRFVKLQNTSSDARQKTEAIM